MIGHNLYKKIRWVAYRDLAMSPHYSDIRDSVAVYAVNVKRYLDEYMSPSQVPHGARKIEAWAIEAATERVPDLIRRSLGLTISELLSVDDHVVIVAKCRKKINCVNTYDCESVIKTLDVIELYAKAQDLHKDNHFSRWVHTWRTRASSDNLAIIHINVFFKIEVLHQCYNLNLVRQDVIIDDSPVTQQLRKLRLNFMENESFHRQKKEHLLNLDRQFLTDTEKKGDTTDGN